MTTMTGATRLLRTGVGRGVAFVAATILVMVVCAQVSAANPYLGIVITTTAVYAIAATGLDIVVGWLREISVGQAAAMAVGAYCAAPLLADHPLLALGAAAVGGGVTGVIVGLPAIRVRGFALATYTLVTGLAIQLLLSDVKAFGGTAGQAVLPGTVFGFDLVDPSVLVVVSVGLTAVGIAVYYLLNHSMVGLSWRAVGLNSQMAGSLAVNPIGARLSAFGVAGVFAGVAGMLFAIVSGYLAPDMFSFTVSIQLLAMVVIGGRVHPLGGTVGAVLLTLYTQYLPASTYSEALLGLILALSVWLAPRGAALYIGDGASWLAKRWRPSTSDSLGPALPEPGAVPVKAANRAAPPVTFACHDITKAYSGVVAVNDVSLSLRTGQITAIVGANGAGKTTLLDLLSGVVTPTAGTVRMGERDVTTLTAWRRARGGLLRCFQDAALFPEFTVRQALFIAGYRHHRYSTVAAVLRLPHVRRRNRIVRTQVEQVAAQFGLTEWLGTPLNNLSLGMVKIVQLAAVVLAAPQWILLDEPAAGLARAEVDRLGGLLRVMSEQLPDSGLLLVEHDALLVAGAADRVVVMAEGAVVEDIAQGAEGWDALLRSRAVGADQIRAAVPAAPVPRVAVSDGERVEANDLTISYGRFVAVRGVSLSIPRGRLSVLVGTNGAGKSSMLNAIVGLKPPATGTVTLDGADLGGSSPHTRARNGLVLVPSGRGLMAALTVADNLRVTRGMRGESTLDPLELFPELKPRLKQRAGTLSGGEQQMLALARSVQLNPRYLLVDELSLGLSVTVVERLIAALLAMRDAGMGLLIVEQNAPLALSYSDHAYVMNNGRVAFDGSSAEAAARPDLFRPIFLDPAHT
jgi:branched-chain amino acid transport system ATP-binding protein/branched-chain amino acid transport system permease protein